MKFVLFAEGHTEKKALPPFLKRWLDPQLAKPIAIKVVRFDGWQDYERDIAAKVRLHMIGPGGADVIAAIGLIDLYGPTFYPSPQKTVAQRIAWATDYFSKKVNNARFRQHFAVHETEAWLLSDSSVLPVTLPAKSKRPEEVNFAHPPARLLDELYRSQLKRPYKKVVDGYNLFSKLSPETAESRCPYFKSLLHDMLGLAKQAQI